MTTLNIRDDGQVHNAVINLEACSDGELYQVMGSPAVHELYHTIARLLLIARDNRKSGHIYRAQRLEAKVDAMYAVLPAQLRW